MFEFLSQTSAPQATAGIYYATRLIRHLKSAEDGLKVKDLKSEPSTAEEFLAKRIISEIEMNEQTTVTKLDKLKAEEYIQKLSDILQSLLQDNLKYDRARGKQLLGELRKKDFYQGVRRLSDFGSSSVRWVSYGAVAISILVWFGGINLANIAANLINPTIIEAVIAVLNIVLACVVLWDLEKHPVRFIDDNSPASNSFKQLVRGWQLLWFTWILFYACLAVQWFHLTDPYPRFTSSLALISELLNVINGFFFYYLFFVLDQPSVSTAREPERAKAFRRNCKITFILGLGVFVVSSLLGWNEGLVSKVVASYVAVGMAFFFGRLDSHYLKVPRIILAPLYLYAVIQLFWDHNTFNNKDFNSERITVFSMALILKLVIFLVLSKLIRHERFREYFIIAEKGLRLN